MPAAPGLKNMNNFRGKERPFSFPLKHVYITPKHEKMFPRTHPSPQQMTLMLHWLELSHMLMPQPITGKGVDPLGPGPTSSESHGTGTWPSQELNKFQHLQEGGRPVKVENAGLTTRGPLAGGNSLDASSPKGKPSLQDTTSQG